MLRQLRIRDFAIIDELTITFEAGFNVITGETGAGKSIVIDALGLTLGERAQSDMIRTGKSETVAEALFDVPMPQFLKGLGIPAGDEIILRRTLLSSGKSRAFINDTAVNAQTLFEFGRSLVDMHGQHEHQSLLFAENQRAVLDAYGKLANEKAEVEKLFREVQSIRSELSGFKADIKEKEHRIDLLKFQINDIDSVSLQSGEKETLAEERTILANLTKLNELSDTAYSLLYSGDGSLSEKLSSAVSLLTEISQIDAGIKEVLNNLREAMPLIEDSSASLRKYRDRYDVDPKRLGVVEDRLDIIKRLERKYGEGVECILKYREDAAMELDALTLSDEKLKQLEDTLGAKEKTLSTQSAKLSDMRKHVAHKIEEAVRAVLKELAMEKAEFKIEFKQTPLTSAGMDHVEFMLSANQGEIPKPLGRVASGGELSRIMLALKGILADADSIPVLIFDEVDAGIGGKTAETVGKRLKNLARKHQVLCITHLPQIAAMADHHIMIEKTQKKAGVYVKVNELLPEERWKEIARMLSGKITDTSLRHAKELLEGIS